jgi:hypothetical protein
VVVASGADFTAAGHTVALILGMLLSTRFRAATHWTLVRLVLLAGGVAVGYLMLIGVSLPAAPVAGSTGMLVALIARWVARRWRSRRVHQSTAFSPLGQSGTDGYRHRHRRLFRCRVHDDVGRKALLAIHHRAAAGADSARQ